MKKRVITALIIVAVVAIPLGFGGIPLEILSLFIVLTGAWEWTHATPSQKQWPRWILPVLIACVIVSRYVPESYRFAAFAIPTMFFWILTIFVETFSIADFFYCITFFYIFALLYSTMGWLEAGHHHLYLITVAFANYGSDTGAWFVGRKWGKHKMNPRLSPKKSWEGFFGGIVSGALISYLVSLLYMPYLTLPTYVNVLLWIGCPIIAELGDLSFSAIKRYYHKKDFSNFLPGHGGILDRVDSLLMNILFLGILLSLSSAL
ncbi:phosphatidate cytidylyltransferase [Catenisphaera adipataccumulans]|jgi:phosphatidate cytidylyltransferase|uniref:Phosphatidate cytidylyltransferase n=1 Tax=Catenisphaera adipataccumulans TaxID=700500 RepID=A0A7W8CYG6_9FIRM|nr:phosphatidate cytidylyltransferase [Catenisphaera adipataccumulans]MBB5183913.1 phosphatidate cytidylyltransferase [Catenisphaera adipataccumulans]